MKNQFRFLKTSLKDQTTYYLVDDIDELITDWNSKHRSLFNKYYKSGN